MWIITAFICFALAVLARHQNKNLINPQTLFCGFIGLIVFLAGLQLFDMIKASDYTYCIVIAGIVFYYLGVELIRSINTKYNSKIFVNKTAEFHTKNKFLMILGCMLLLWSLYRLVTVVIPLLKRGYPLDTIRMIYFGAEFQGISYSRIDNIMEMFVNLPFLYAAIPIIAIEVSKKKEERDLSLGTMIIIFAWIVLSCIISGGRLLLYVLACTLVIVFSLNKRTKKNHITIDFKYKIGIIFIVAFLIVGMYFLSKNRTTDTSFNMFYSIYVYFCGCIPHMSMRLDTVSIDYTYGFTFFSGFLRPIMLLYKYLIGNGNFPDIYQRTIDIGVELQTPVNITPYKTFNAFVLPFYYFYYDAGILGVIIESFLYGAFCGNAYFKATKNNSKKHLAKYLLVTIYIMTSMIRFNLSLVYFVFAYFYIDFCFNRVINNVKET